MHIQESHISQLANLLVTHSCKVQPGEVVWIESIDVEDRIVEAVVEAVFDADGIPLVSRKSQSLMISLANRHDEAGLRMMADHELAALKDCHCFIGLRAPENLYANQAITKDQRALLLQYYLKPVHYTYRNHHLRWVYVRIPTEAFAQESRMSGKEFSDYYFRAVFQNYQEMNRQLLPLKRILEDTAEVRITHPNGTDLSFTLSGAGTYISTGGKNIPDGEIFTSPLKKSVEGTITFNIPSTYYGQYFPEITLQFRKGKVVWADAGMQTAALEQLLDTDEGARYIGEFAFGVNHAVTAPINDILFDEKMAGSIHVALGNAYPVSDNGNKSAIHWDLILAQSKEYGGGKVFINGQLIRQDGLFTLPELFPLNSPLSPIHQFT